MAIVQIYVEIDCIHTCFTVLLHSKSLVPGERKEPEDRLTTYMEIVHESLLRR